MHSSRRGAAWLKLIEVWWRLFRGQALAGVDFADGYEIDKATRDAPRQLNPKASPWVGGGWKPKPPQVPPGLLRSAPHPRFRSAVKLQGCNLRCSLGLCSVRKG